MRYKLAYCALGLLTVALSVSAQEGLRDRERGFSASQQISSDLRKARFRSGAFYLLSSINLSDIGYESAFFVPTTEQGSGISFGISAPNRLYYVPSKKAVFSVQATPEYTFFTGGSGNGRSSNQFGYLTRADAQFLLNHLYLDFYGARSDSLVPYSGEIDRLVTRRQDGVGLNGEIKYSSKTSLAFQTGYRGTTFPRNRYQPLDVAIDQLNRTEQNYRLSFIHKTFALASLNLAAERANYTFEKTSTKDSHRTFFGAGVTYSDGRNGFHVEAGPGKLEFKDPSQKNYSGILGNADYTRRGGLWTFNLTANRDLEFSLAPLNNYYVLDRGTLLLEYAVTRKLKLRFSDSAGVDRYDVPAFTASGRLVRRRDNINFVAVGWLYTLHRVTGGFDVGYYKRTSNAEIGTQDGIRGILHLSFTP